MGRPIIAYSIETAKAANDDEGNPLFDDVWVSTEDQEIAAIARRHGARVIERDPRLAEDHVGTQTVMASALTQIQKRYTKARQPTQACCIYATCPMLTNSDLERGWRALIGHTGAYFAFAVCDEPHFGPAGYFYWGGARAFIANHPLVSERSVMIPIPPERCVDINTEEDWTRAEQMYAALQHGHQRERHALEMQNVNGLL